MSNVIEIHAITYEDISSHEMYEWLQYPENKTVNKKIDRKEWKKRQRSKLRQFLGKRVKK